MGMLKWYVDGLHNVHPDCRGHGGALFSMGKGATTSYLRKLKLITRSLMESKLVTADMYMPEMLVSLYFIQAHGYEAECMGLYPLSYLLRMDRCQVEREQSTSRPSSFL